MATDPLRPLRSDADLDWAIRETERLWGAPLGTPDGDRLDILATLIDAYENSRYPIEPVDPIDAIMLALENRGLTRNALVPILGSHEHVAEVLDRKRDLDVAMIRRLRAELGISADVLVGRDGIRA